MSTFRYTKNKKRQFHKKNWDNINVKRIIANDLIFHSLRDLARFKALQCRELGSWLHAIPSPNIGTLLDNTSFQVCIGLRYLHMQCES
jgi:hypothetical protein